MNLTTHEIGFASLDGMPGVDSLCLFVAEDERPLRGTAGYVDWRMCGALSRVLRGGFFTGSSGDCLLIPTEGRIAMSRIFAIGIGERQRFGTEALGEVLSNAAGVLTKAQVATVALEIPGAGAVDESTRAASLVKQFLPAFKGGRVAVLSERSVARLLNSSASG